MPLWKSKHFDARTTRTLNGKQRQRNVQIAFSDYPHIRALLVDHFAPTCARLIGSRDIKNFSDGCITSAR